jgi:protein SCO1/2
MNLRLAIAALLLATSVAGCGASAPPPPDAAGQGFKGGEFDPPHPAPDFALDGTTGPVTLAAYRGKVVILEFGFTTCQKVCPTTLAKLKQVFEELGPAGSEVQVLFVTVDPERDTLERLGAFLAGYHESFVGATGTPEQLASIRDAYGVLATKELSEGPDGYQVHHSSSLYLIDREGRLRVLEPFAKPPGDIAHDLRLLLETP